MVNTKIRLIKFFAAKDGEALFTVSSREHTSHSKHLFQQHKRQLYLWKSPDGQYQNQIDYILCSQRWRSCVQSAKQDLELTVLKSLTPYCKFTLKLRKVGKTTRPFRYDLNQTPYDYTVEMINRFKG